MGGLLPATGAFKVVDLDTIASLQINLCDRTSANWPAAYNGIVITIPTSDQSLMQFATDDSFFYVRTKWDTWYEWKKIVLERVV